MKKITLDTNILPLDDSLFKDKLVEIVVVSVTGRELENHKFSSELKKFKRVKESAVWDESKWGQTKWGPVIYETAVVGESRIGESVVGSNKESTYSRNYWKL